MSDEPDNIVLRYLRRMDAKLDEVRTDMVEIKGRLGLLEQGLALLSRRVDRMAGDVDLIKRRLDLVEG